MLTEPPLLRIVASLWNKTCKFTPQPLQLQGPARAQPAQSTDNSAMTTQEQPRNPLHGVTLERILTELVDYYDWAGLGERVPVGCFTYKPSITSSLRFLRKTPWAREKVESLYLYMLREQLRNQTQSP